MFMLDRVSEVMVWTEVYDAGRSQDFGTREEGLRAFVVAVTPLGFRFRHAVTFNTSTWVLDPDGFSWFLSNIEQDKDHAAHLADRITRHLSMGGGLNPDHWTRIQGVYGSPAWDEQAEIETEMSEYEAEICGSF